MSASDLSTRPHPFNLARPGWSLVVDGLDWSWAYVIHRDIPGYPGYAIGSDGTVWSRRRRYGNQPALTDRWAALNPHGLSSGHRIVGMRPDGGGWARRLVHRLVLEVFVGPPPAGTEACHFPARAPGNNALRNLRWDTRSANKEDSREHGTITRGSKIGISRLTEDQIPEIRRLAAEGVRHRVIWERFGVSRATIQRVLARTCWAHIPTQQATPDDAQPPPQ